MNLPRVYPIVDSAAWVARLAPQGVRLVQLRIKEQPEASVRSQIEAAQALCRAAGVQLIVNDYWQLALATGCDFVHLGQGDLDCADVAALRRAGVRVGISTHDERDVVRSQRKCPLERLPGVFAAGADVAAVVTDIVRASDPEARVRQWVVAGAVR